jgi:small subunit ribosomal protein S10
MSFQQSKLLQITKCKKRTFFTFAFAKLGAKNEQPKRITYEKIRKMMRLKNALGQPNDVQRVRIKLESFNHEPLVSECEKLVSLFESIADRYLVSKPNGAITLPTSKRIYCVLRSPHVDKDSREHFEIRTHKRFIDLYGMNDSIIDLFHFLSKLEIEPGVFCSVSFASN